MLNYKIVNIGKTYIAASKDSSTKFIFSEPILFGIVKRLEVSPQSPQVRITSGTVSLRIFEI